MLIINVYFLIAGLENKYLFGKSECPWAHELTSQTGGELMSWSPSVSAALLKLDCIDPFEVFELDLVSENNEKLMDSFIEKSLKRWAGYNIFIFNWNMLNVTLVFEKKREFEQLSMNLEENMILDET